MNCGCVFDLRIDNFESSLNSKYERFVVNGLKVWLTPWPNEYGGKECLRLVQVLTRRRQISIVV
jgi:hypothetical protein